MTNHLSRVLLGISLYFLTNSQLTQTKEIRTTKEICVKDPISSNDLRMCYVNDVRNKSILVWFTIGPLSNKLFDSYRFVLRSAENLSLTNFTELVDFNNSLRLFNFNLGEYEVCIQFISNSSSYVYQFRDGCLPISIGNSSYESFQYSSTALLIALASGIVLFFILGLVVQWGKTKRQRKQAANDEPRSRSWSALSSASSKQRRHRFVRKLFHRHIDEGRPSHVRQWARNHAFRHRISTDEPETHKSRTFGQWSKQLLTSADRLSQPRLRAETASMPTTERVPTISDNVHRQLTPRVPSFYLSPPEEYEMM